MAGKSPLAATDDQRRELVALSHSRDRGEADRARAIVLTLLGWTRGQIGGLRGARGYGSVLAQHFHDGRHRSLEDIGRAGASARQSRACPGRGRAGPVWACSGSPELDAVAVGRRDRDARGRAHLALAAVACAPPKGDFRWRRPRHTLKGRQDADAVDRAGLRRKLLKAQAEAGDIVLLFGDESEALTHPYLAHAWAKKGADLRIPAPGQAAKVAMLGLLDWAP